MTKDPKKRPEDEEEKGFKVIDRRRVDRDVEEPEEKEPEETALKDEPASEPESSQTSEEAKEEPSAPAGFTGEDAFAQFIISLSTSAFMQLGLVPGPDGKTMEKSLPMAKQTIDILGMLEEKTKGNLSELEEKIMNQVLNELRMRYVEARRQEK